MNGYDPIVSVRWKDTHQTMAVVVTESGKEYALPNKHLPRGAVAEACYTPISGRYVTEQHDAAVIETVESGSVMISPRDTPALWEAAHTAIQLAPYDSNPPSQSDELPPQPSEGEELLSMPVLPLPERPVPVRGWSVSSLLSRAADGEPPANLNAQAMPEAMNDSERVDTAVSLAMTLDDAARRRLAQSRLAEAVSEWMKKAFENRPRYELAVQAMNDLPFALEMFEPEAKVRGVPIKTLCQEIILSEQAKHRRMSHVHTLNAKALGDINGATGDDIDGIATTAVAAIMGE